MTDDRRTRSTTSSPGDLETPGRDASRAAWRRSRPSPGTSSSSAAGSSAAAPCSTRSRAACAPSSSSRTTSPSGTSSRSSRLIHGGLRYLEQFRFGLVREALAERSRLLHLAPHLVTIEPLLFPIYGIPFASKAFYDAGLTLYDILGARHDGGWHRRLSRAATLELAPTLRATDCAAGSSITTASRTTRATRSPSPAPRSSTAPSWSPGSGRRPPFRRHLRDGSPPCARATSLSGADLEIRTRAVLDATGVWEAEPDHPFGGGSMRILPSRGAHLVVPRSRIPNADRADDPGARARSSSSSRGRTHWLDRHDGRTRTRVDLDHPAADGWEIDKLLDTVNATMDVDLRREDVVGTFAGLRPLIAPSTGSTVKASREHRVTVESNGVVRIGGGKYTTYRVMARDAIDAVLGRDEAARAPERDGRPPAGRRRRSPMRSTRIAAELDTIAAVAAVGARSRRGSSPATAPRRPGSSASAPSAISSGRSSPGRPFLEAEVVWAVRHELALSLDDVHRPADPPRAGAARPRRGRRPAGGRAHGRRAGLGRDPAGTRGRVVPRDGPTRVLGRGRRARSSVRHGRPCTLRDDADPRRPVADVHRRALRAPDPAARSCPRRASSRSSSWRIVGAGSRRPCGTRAARRIARRRPCSPSGCRSPGISPHRWSSAPSSSNRHPWRRRRDAAPTPTADARRTRRRRTLDPPTATGVTVTGRHDADAVRADRAVARRAVPRLRRLPLRPRARPP